MNDLKKKVLVIDDDEELHVLYGLYLRGESYEILKALHGEEALRLMAEEKPDLIVLDMIMPVMDGEEFLRHVHGQDSMRDIPIIIASVNEKIPQKILDLGNIYTTLRKPFTIETLIDKIHEVFAHKKRQ